MSVVEAAGKQVLLAGRVQGEQAGESVARLPCRGIGEQVDLAGEARERGHDRSRGVIFENELRDEDGIGEVGKRVIKSLGRVDAAEGIEIGFGIFANEHKSSDSGERFVVDEWCRGPSSRGRLEPMGSEDAMAKQRMDAGESFRCVEGVCASGDAVKRERGLRHVGDGLVCQRMRQGLEQGIVFEREVRAFVGFDEDQNACSVA